MCNDAWINQKAKLTAEEIASYVGTQKFSCDDARFIYTKLVRLMKDTLREELEVCYGTVSASERSVQ